MRNNENDQGKYLTTEEYKELINNLIEDKDRQECYVAYCQKYLTSNPNFEFKFFEIVRDLGYPERSEYYISTDIDKAERERIENFWLSDDQTHYSNYDQCWRKLYLWASNNSKSLKYTYLCWELLTLTEEPNEIEEDYKADFSGLEKIYILKLLSDTNWQKSITKNKSLAIVLSKVTGLKVSTLVSYLQDYKEHWEPTTFTEGEKKARQLSLNKIKGLLNEAGSSTLTTKMITNMGSEIDKFHFFD